MPIMAHVIAKYGPLLTRDDSEFRMREGSFKGKRGRECPGADSFNLGDELTFFVLVAGKIV